MIINVGGGGGTPKKLPVLDPEFPADYSGDVGSSVEFSIRIIEPGFPEVYTYQWFVDGVAVEFANNESFAIDSVSKGESYVYCEVTSAAGTIRSKMAKLNGGRLWLFDNGEQYSSVTGGWHSDDSDSGVSNDVIVAHGTTPVSTMLQIDVTKYSKLVVTSKQSWASGSPEQGAGVAFGLSSDRTSEGYAAKISGTWTGLKTLDISGVSGAYYVKSHTYLAYLEVSQVYLE